MVVDFIIIGAMKSGTSSLRNILKKHPEIEFSVKEEPHFFSKTNNWKSNLESYHKLFKLKNKKLCGEGSTTYTQYPHFNLELWNDIYDYNKNIKFIYMVRNPVERAISHYMHLYQRGKINCTIEKAIKQYPEIINTSRYYTQLKPFIELFGIEKILLIDFDDFINHREFVINNLAYFLEISKKGFVNYDDEHSNKTIGNYKINYKYDFLIKLLSPYKRLFSKNIRRKVVKLFFYTKKRAVANKPSLNKKNKNIILNLVRSDINDLSYAFGKDFTKWL